MSFDINKIQQYFLARSKAELAKNPDSDQSAEQRAKEDFEKMPNKNFNIRVIFSIFDANKDGKITREEFEKVSETEYISFTDKLKEYNIKNSRGNSNNSIWSYAQMENYLNDHISPNEISEDEIYYDDVDLFFLEKQQDGKKQGEIEMNDYSGTHGLKETFNLKDISQMTREEIVAELESYNITPKSNGIKSLIFELINARKERAKHDIGSDSIDGHIGTFTQNKTGVCTVLAHIGTMSDEEIRQLFVFDKGHDFDNPMLDENGKKYWYIKFPIDKNNDKKIKITEDELKSGKIEIEEFGKTKTIKEFPEGDGDVTAISMAFVKRFGSEIVQYGEWAYITRNRFTKPEDTKYKDNQYLEMITDYKSLEGTVIGGLNPDEIRRKQMDGIREIENEDLSWIPDKDDRMTAQNSEGFIYTIKDGAKRGLKACITRHGTFLEDGTKIEQLHAMEIRRYDEKTNELIISGSEFNNMSEVRIPVELLKFYETASLPGTPGVDETPDPGLIDDKI